MQRTTGGNFSHGAEFNQITLTPNDLVCLLPISEQLLADANINLVQFIIELFAEAIGLAEDQAFFTGSGTGRPKGINQETLSSKDALGTGDFDDVIDLIDLVPSRVTQSPKAAFVGHKRAIKLFRKIKDNKRVKHAILIFMNQAKGNFGSGVCGNTFVYFKDGIKVKEVRIKEVVEKKLKGEILTLDEATRLFEYKKIKGWFKIGTVKDKADLINIQVENLGKKHGDNNNFIITLTPTHKVLTRRSWVEAGELTPDDFLITSYMSLQGEMREFLYAMTVGDSHILADSNNSKNTAALNLQDSRAPKYIKWKVGKLSPWINFHPSSRGVVSEYTHDLKLLKDEISAFEVASSRSPLPFLERHFSLLGLAIWIMDDGHLDKQGSYYLSFGRLARHKGVLGITSWWFNKLGYKNSILKDGRLFFNKTVSRKIAIDICQFVPRCMDYKLPEDLKNKYKEFKLDYSLELLPEYVKFISKRNASDRQMNKLRGIYGLEIEGSDNYMVGNHASGVIVKAGT
ncbi:MAG: HK97 family prophage LambdaSa04 protein [Microgenomates group bacterium Gr01-1014_7]|nr:MAG: HK97 family prophage LambdaSa04 protein [Microgenomates group bacterium Gr01-1014_7]